VDVGAGDAAEKDVAEDDDLAAAQVGAEALAHGEGVEQALGGMLVRAVAGVDDGDAEDVGEVERGAGGGVPDDDHVGAEGGDVFGGVAQGLALGGRGAGAVERNDVGREALGRHLEGHAGAGAGLEEEVDDGLAAQGGDFFDAALQDFFEGGGGVVDLVDLGDREFFQSEQMAAGPGHGKSGRGESAGLGGDDFGVIVGGVFGVQDDDDFFGAGGVEDEAGVVGGDGQEASAAVDEHGELDLGRAAVVEEFVEGGLDGAAGVEHVVDEDDGGSGHVHGDDRGLVFLGDGLVVEVVAVKRDVDGAGGAAGQEVGDAAGEFDAAVGDAEEDEPRGARMTPGDVRGELLDGLVQFLGGDAVGYGHEGQLVTGRPNR